MHHQRIQIQSGQALKLEKEKPTKAMGLTHYRSLLDKETRKQEGEGCFNEPYLTTANLVADIFAVHQMFEVAKRDRQFKKGFGPRNQRVRGTLLQKDVITTEESHVKALLILQT